MLIKRTVNKPKDPRPKIQDSRDGSLGIWGLGLDPSLRSGSIPLSFSFHFVQENVVSLIWGLKLFSLKNLFT